MAPSMKDPILGEWFSGKQIPKERCIQNLAGKEKKERKRG